MYTYKGMDNELQVYAFYNSTNIYIQYVLFILSHVFIAVYLAAAFRELGDACYNHSSCTYISPLSLPSVHALTSCRCTISNNNLKCC